MENLTVEKTETPSAYCFGDGRDAGTGNSDLNIVKQPTLQWPVGFFGIQLLWGPIMLMESLQVQ